MVPVKHMEKNASDEALLEEYQASHRQDALAILYLRYADLVYGTCLKYLKNAEDSRDASMDIYNELVIKLRTHTVSHFKGWLHIVTRNHCLMRLRKEKKTTVVEIQPDFMQPEDFSHLDEVLEKERELIRLEACIAKLQPHQQQVIRQFYLENKCYRVIATDTGMDWDRVRSLVQNGRRNLKICMEKHD